MVKKMVTKMLEGIVNLFHTHTHTHTIPPPPTTTTTQPKDFGVNTKLVHVALN